METDVFYLSANLPIRSFQKPSSSIKHSRDDFYVIHFGIAYSMNNDRKTIFTNTAKKKGYILSSGGDRLKEKGG